MCKAMPIKGASVYLVDQTNGNRITTKENERRKKYTNNQHCDDKQMKICIMSNSKGGQDTQIYIQYDAFTRKD